MPYKHPEILVDTQWLADRLGDPKIRIVEVEMSPEALQDAHIPGAVRWNVLADLALPDLRFNFDLTAMTNLLKRSGISHETTIVAYGSFPSASAAMFWLMQVFGHQQVRVLNGGHQKWMAEGRPVTSELATVEATPYDLRSLDSSLRAFHRDVEAARDRSDAVLLDVRTLEEYVGDAYVMAPPKGDERAGHIPGAVHLSHTEMLNADGTFKSFEELSDLLASRGVTPDKEVIPYCAVGARSGFTWFVLKYLLGYPQVRNYDGSWSEWSRLPDAAIATGTPATFV